MIPNYPPPPAPLSPTDEARRSVRRAALALSKNQRHLAEQVETAAQLTVIRRLLSAQLPGGEAEFWQLVEVELRK